MRVHVRTLCGVCVSVCNNMPYTLFLSLSLFIVIPLLFHPHSLLTSSSPTIFHNHPSAFPVPLPLLLTEVNKNAAEINPIFCPSVCLSSLSPTACLRLCLHATGSPSNHFILLSGTAKHRPPIRSRGSRGGFSSLC